MPDAKIYTITVTQDELDLIGTALIEFPYRVVVSLVNNLQAQMIAQQLSPANPTQPPASTEPLAAEPAQAQTPVELPPADPN